MKKILALGIILLFIGVAVAPSINFTVVKASNENDLVEVTTQACGIKGFGDSTVKLTRQQYQNLEQYLVDFRARLNQTSTREEAIPIFKEAVVELNKYGLLPKGMSIERAQKLVIGRHYNTYLINLIKRFNNEYSNQVNENYYCIIAGVTDLMTEFQGYITSFLWALADFPNFGILYPLLILSWIVNKFLPISVFQRIGLGGLDPEVGGFSPARGWVFTVGVLGMIKWSGKLTGAIGPYHEVPFGIIYDAVDGFTGLRIFLGINFYIGTAYHVAISQGGKK
jgi:hypothetical protein